MVLIMASCGWGFSRVGVWSVGIGWEMRVGWDGGSCIGSIWGCGWSADC